MLDAQLVAFVLDSLPRAPARLLEIGAGSGELADHLRLCGYDVVAIDPASESPAIEPIALAHLDEQTGGFDAAVAVLSLHHVDPLAESCRRLAEAVRPGGVLVVDEFDIAAFDPRAARWWLDQRPAHEAAHPDPDAIVAGLRTHLHTFDELLTALRRWFDFSETQRGPYLYRWKLDPELRTTEEERINRGLLNATGARTVGRRRL